MEILNRGHKAARILNKYGLGVPDMSNPDKEELVGEEIEKFQYFWSKMGGYLFHPMGCDMFNEEARVVACKYWDRIVNGRTIFEGNRSIDNEHQFTNLHWRFMLEVSGLSNALRNGGFCGWVRDGLLNTDMYITHPIEQRVTGVAEAIGKIDWDSWEWFWRTTTKETLRNALLILKSGHLPVTDADLRHYREPNAEDIAGAAESGVAVSGGLQMQTFITLYSNNPTVWHDLTAHEWERQLIDAWNLRFAKVQPDGSRY